MSEHTPSVDVEAQRRRVCTLRSGEYKSCLRGSVPERDSRIIVSDPGDVTIFPESSNSFFPVHKTNLPVPASACHINRFTTPHHRICNVRVAIVSPHSVLADPDLSRVHVRCKHQSVTDTPWPDISAKYSRITGERTVARCGDLARCLYRA